MTDIYFYLNDPQLDSKASSSPVETLDINKLIERQKTKLLLHMREWIRRRHPSFALWPESDQKKWIHQSLTLDKQQWLDVLEIMEEGTNLNERAQMHRFSNGSESQLKKQLIAHFHNQLSYLAS